MHYINRFTCRSPHKIRNVTKFLFLPRKKTLSLTLLFSYFCFLVFCTLCLIFLWNFYKRWKMSDKISGNFRQFFCFCCKKIKIVIKYLKATILYKLLPFRQTPFIFWGHWKSTNCFCQNTIYQGIDFKKSIYGIISGQKVTFSAPSYFLSLKHVFHFFMTLLYFL